MKEADGNKSARAEDERKAEVEVIGQCESRPQVKYN